MDKRVGVIASVVIGLGLGLAWHHALATPSPAKTPLWVTTMADGWFALFDANADGNVTPGEYKAGGGITTAVGLWPFAQVDRNSDQRATQAELTEAVAAYFVPKLRVLTEGAFKGADADGDGRLSVAEFHQADEVGIRPKTGFTLGDSLERVAAFDEDQDGRLNAIEFQAAIGDAFARTFGLQTGRNPALRLELMTMYRADQALRGEATGVTDGRTLKTLAERMVALDAQHTERMQTIIKTFGWPTRSLVGEDGAIAAWCLVQHADHLPAFQRHCLPLLEAAAQSHEARLPDVAYLTDRVLVNEGKEQRYGTQCHTVDGKLVPKPIHAPAEVDRRRRQMGLGPLSEYLKELARH